MLLSQDHLGIFSLLNFTFLVLRTLTRAAKNKKEGTLDPKQTAWSALLWVAWKLRHRKYLPWVYTQAKLPHIYPLSPEPNTVNHYRVASSYLFNLKKSYRSSFSAPLSCWTVIVHEIEMCMWNYCKKTATRKAQPGKTGFRVLVLSLLCAVIKKSLVSLQEQSFRECCNGWFLCSQLPNTNVSSHMETHWPNQDILCAASFFFCTLRSHWQATILGVTTVASQQISCFPLTEPVRSTWR